MDIMWFCLLKGLTLLFPFIFWFRKQLRLAELCRDRQFLEREIAECEEQRRLLSHQPVHLARDILKGKLDARIESLETCCTFVQRALDGLPHWNDEKMRYDDQLSMLKNELSKARGELVLIVHRDADIVVNEMLKNISTVMSEDRERVLQINGELASLGRR